MPPLGIQRTPHLYPPAPHECSSSSSPTSSPSPPHGRPFITSKNIVGNSRKGHFFLFNLFKSKNRKSLELGCTVTGNPLELGCRVTWNTASALRSTPPFPARRPSPTSRGPAPATRSPTPAPGRRPAPVPQGPAPA